MTDTARGIDASVQTATIASQGRGLTRLLVGGGLIGLVAAAVLLIEKIRLIENPDYIPSCSLNPVLSCGSVMTTSQAEAFGFPNPIIGVAGFATLLMTGVGLAAGATFRGWFWAVMQSGVTFAVLFVHWLIYQSLYVIGALCPYCMVVWAVTIPVFWGVTTANMVAASRGWGVSSRRVIAVVVEYRGAVLTAWYLLVIALVAQRFWDYWITIL